MTLSVGADSREIIRITYIHAHKDGHLGSGNNETRYCLAVARRGRYVATKTEKAKCLTTCKNAHDVIPNPK